MNFNQSIKLNKYSETATKKLNDMQSRLSKTESSFETRMNGKSTGGLIGTVIGVILWLVVFGIGAVIASATVDSIILTVGVAVVAILMLFMIVDSVVNIVYYGRISNYRGAVSRLSQRVRSGKSSIMKNHDLFISAKSRGWNHPFNVANSIPDEAEAIETKMSSIENLRTGFLNGGKNVFYYASVIAVTAIGSLALFPWVIKTVTNITDGSLNTMTILIICIVATVLACIGEILLAKMVWEKTDLNVTPVTLLILLVAPVLFALIIAVGTLIVAIVMFVLGIIVYLIGIVAALAIAYSCLCGG